MDCKQKNILFFQLRALGIKVNFDKLEKKAILTFFKSHSGIDIADYAIENYLGFGESNL